MATFADYDEERRLVSEFGENNVSWQGGEWAVRLGDKAFTVPRGAATKYGTAAIKGVIEERL